MTLKYMYVGENSEVVRKMAKSNGKRPKVIKMNSNQMEANYQSVSPAVTDNICVRSILIT